jgi:hypothetical protein
LHSTISGEKILYSHGGNGGWSIQAAQAFDSTIIGGGGMGARAAGEASGTAAQTKPAGGAGGNGIAIIKYPNSRISEWTISSITSYSSGSISIETTSAFNFAALSFTNYVLILNGRSYVASFSASPVSGIVYQLTITGSFPSPAVGNKIQLRRPDGKYSNAILVT